MYSSRPYYYPSQGAVVHDEPNPLYGYTPHPQPAYEPSIQYDYRQQPPPPQPHPHQQMYHNPQMYMPPPQPQYYPYPPYHPPVIPIPPPSNTGTMPPASSSMWPSRSQHAPEHIPRTAPQYRPDDPAFSSDPRARSQYFRMDDSEDILPREQSSFTDKKSRRTRDREGAAAASGQSAKHDTATPATRSRTSLHVPEQLNHESSRGSHRRQASEGSFYGAHKSRESVRLAYEDPEEQEDAHRYHGHSRKGHSSTSRHDSANMDRSRSGLSSTSSSYVNITTAPSPYEIFKPPHSPSTSSSSSSSEYSPPPRTPPPGVSAYSVESKRASLEKEKGSLLTRNPDERSLGSVVQLPAYTPQSASSRDAPLPRGSGVDDGIRVTAILLPNRQAPPAVNAVPSSSSSTRKGKHSPSGSVGSHSQSQPNNVALPTAPETARSQATGQGGASSSSSEARDAAASSLRAATVPSTAITNDSIAKDSPPRPVQPSIGSNADIIPGPIQQTRSRSRNATTPNAAQKDLDRIDELDETDPLGYAWHHESPYEAIRRAGGDGGGGMGGREGGRRVPKIFMAQNGQTGPAGGEAKSRKAVPVDPNVTSFKVKPGQIFPPIVPTAHARGAARHEITGINVVGDENADGSVNPSSLRHEVQDGTGHGKGRKHKREKPAFVNTYLRPGHQPQEQPLPVFSPPRSLLEVQPLPQDQRQRRESQYMPQGQAQMVQQPQMVQQGPYSNPPPQPHAEQRDRHTHDRDRGRDPSPHRGRQPLPSHSRFIETPTPQYPVVIPLPSGPPPQYTREPVPGSTSRPTQTLQHQGSNATLARSVSAPAPKGPGQGESRGRHGHSHSHSHGERQLADPNPNPNDRGRGGADPNSTQRGAGTASGSARAPTVHTNGSGSSSMRPPAPHYLPKKLVMPAPLQQAQGQNQNPSLPSLAQPPQAQAPPQPEPQRPPRAHENSDPGPSSGGGGRGYEGGVPLKHSATLPARINAPPSQGQSGSGSGSQTTRAQAIPMAPQRNLLRKPNNKSEVFFEKEEERARSKSRGREKENDNGREKEKEKERRGGVHIGGFTLFPSFGHHSSGRNANGNGDGHGVKAEMRVVVDERERERGREEKERKKLSRRRS